MNVIAFFQYFNKLCRFSINSLNYFLCEIIKLYLLWNQICIFLYTDLHLILKLGIQVNIFIINVVQYKLHIFSVPSLFQGWNSLPFLIFLLPMFQIFSCELSVTFIWTCMSISIGFCFIFLKHKWMKLLLQWQRQLMDKEEWQLRNSSLCIIRFYCNY